MSRNDRIEFPSKGVYRAVKESKNREIRRLKVSIGENSTVVDSPIGLNLRTIPRVFTAPLQAIGLITSIFARMTNTRITLDLRDED